MNWRWGAYREAKIKPVRGCRGEELRFPGPSGSVEEKQLQASGETGLRGPEQLMVGWMAFQERSAAFQISEVWLTKRLEDTTQLRSNYEVLVST